ncbi:MAG: uncharacterized protein QG612_1267 [Pseudomonadota bacterium]|nr:uncharacterized protein [Pseudomonadota bacterium]
MLHPDTQLRWIDDVIGYGVFVTRPIPRGTVVWVRCALDIALTPAQCAELPPAHQATLAHFGYLDATGDTILCWDHGRYINHSCQPAMLSLGDEAEIAPRDLAAGEQLTCEYALCNIVQPLSCRCGVPQCRGLIRADDVFRLESRWADEVAQALAEAGSVAQPLLAFARDPGGLLALLQRERPAPALSSHHFSPPRAA